MTSLLKGLTALCLLGATYLVEAADGMDCWFPPEWKAKAEQAKTIADALSRHAGTDIKPRIATGYSQILQEVADPAPKLLYAGSFIQALVQARGQGTPLVQVVDGKELYSGVMIHPAGADPKAILRDNPTEISFAAGASSGESSAKAATGGKAAFPTPGHQASVGALTAGKVKAAFVKNWWWQANKDKFPNLASYEVPGVSEAKNPDNILTASVGVSAALRDKIAAAALASKEAFGAKEVRTLQAGAMDFSLELMAKGDIDPLSYTWK